MGVLSILCYSVAISMKRFFLLIFLVASGWWFWSLSDGQTHDVPRVLLPCMEWSRSLRLWMSNDDRKQWLTKAYWEQDLGRIQTYLQQGKSGLAQQAYASLEEEWNRFLKNSVATTTREVVGSVAREGWNDFKETDPESAGYRIRQRLQGILLESLSGNAQAQWQVRADEMHIELQQAAKALTEHQQEIAKRLLESVDQGLKNLQQEYGVWRKGLAKEDQERLASTERALQVERDRLKKLLDVQSTSTPAIPMDSSTTRPEALQPLCDSFAVVTEPLQVKVGAMVTHRATVQMNDKTRLLVTPKTMFYRLDGPEKHAVGSTWKADIAGAVRIEARYPCLGVDVVKSINLVIVEAPTRTSASSTSTSTTTTATPSSTSLNPASTTSSANR